MSSHFFAFLLLIFRALSTSCLFFTPFPQVSRRRVKSGVSPWLSQHIHGKRERETPGSLGGRRGEDLGTFTAAQSMAGVTSAG